MIIFTIIGAIIGAGFASGKEIYLFFYKYGICGIAGIFICSVIISYVIYKSLNIIYKNNITKYNEFLEFIFQKNKFFSKFTNYIVNTFLCISFFIMISGFATYISQELNINYMVASTIFVLACYLVFLKNINTITKINMIIVPILIVVILILGVINFNNVTLNEIMEIKVENNFLWLFQAIIYASYNLIILIPVLVNLGQFLKKKRQIMFISIITGIVLLVISLLTYFLLVGTNINFEAIEMPAIYAIQEKFGNFKNIYGIIILIAIFTTAISVGISFINNICKNEESFPQIVIILCTIGLIVSPIGFSNLVKIFFPIFGVLGFFQIWFLITASLK